MKKMEEIFSDYVSNYVKKNFRDEWVSSYDRVMFEALVRTIGRADVVRKMEVLGVVPEKWNGGPIVIDEENVKTTPGEGWTKSDYVENPEDKDAEHTVDFSQEWQESLTLSRTRTKTHGWEAKLTFEKEFAIVKAGIELGYSGSISTSDTKQTLKGKTTKVGSSTKFTIPPRHKQNFTQTITTTNVSAPISMSIKPSGKVRCTGFVGGPVNGGPGLTFTAEIDAQTILDEAKKPDGFQIDWMVSGESGVHASIVPGELEPMS